MIDARTFDVVNEVGKALRRNPNPFGGLQLVVCGDFFQLPPVPDQLYRGTGVPVSFAFEAESWDLALPNKISLTECFARKRKLIKVLTEMRLGDVSDHSLELIRSLARPLEYGDGIKSTEIFPLRNQAEKANQKALSLLKGERATYSSSDEFYKDAYGVYVHPQRGRTSLDRLISDTIELRVGAQVMSVKNLPDTNIVNGSVGVIRGFMTPREVQNRMDLDDSVLGSENSPKSGHGKSNLKQGIWESRRWPIVRFHDRVTRMISPYCFTHKNALGMVEASRWQVPLILAWALTVHKAQGQTLSRVKIDLRGTFEKGQAYVALSRCTSLKGLEVYNFSPDVVQAHPLVQDWHHSLTTIPEDTQNPV